MGKVALITGIAGQDGYWLARLLLDKGYEVHGTVRRHGMGCLDYLPECYKRKITLHSADISSYCAVLRVLENTVPDEIYHLAAYSSVANSWKNPELTYSTNIMGTLNILNGMVAIGSQARMYFAGSSEQFGCPQTSPQSESTPFYPISPYGISKTAAYHACKSYQFVHGMPISIGIAYNHDSFCRSTDFAMAKICHGAAMIKRGYLDHVSLGNTYSWRDFGHASDFAAAYWQMLQRDPAEYVLSGGLVHSIRDICNKAFEYVGLPLTWIIPHGMTLECGVSAAGDILVKTSLDNVRPNECSMRLVGDSSKAIADGVLTRSFNFNQIIEELVDHHMQT